MTIIQRKFKELEDELEGNRLFNKVQKEELKRFLNKQKQKAQSIYSILIENEPACSASDFLTKMIMGSMEKSLQSSEKSFRDRMQRAINENKQRTEQSIDKLSTSVNISIARPIVTRPVLPAANAAKSSSQEHPPTSLHDAIGGLVAHHRNLIFTKRDASRDNGIVDTVAGRMVEDACKLVQTVTFVPKITVLCIQNVICKNDTARMFVNRMGEAIVNTPAAHALANARDSIAERIDHQYGIEPALTHSTLADLAAMATLRLPRFLMGGQGPRSFTVPPSIDRGRMLNVPAQPAGIPTSSTIPGPSILYAKSKAPKGGNSNGGGSGGHRQGFFKETTTTQKTRQIENLGEGVSHVIEKNRQKTQIDEFGKKTTTVDTETIFSLEYSRSARKELEKMDSCYKEGLLRKIEQLKIDPHHSAKRLSGGDQLHSLRHGDYRAIYRVEQKTVVIKECGHRNYVYDGL